ncbi:MAG: hypothetical protein AVDCRST_MAG13-2100, partial [uncultured Solirubrobacteraceae bacterium]
MTRGGAQGAGRLAAGALAALA